MDKSETNPWANLTQIEDFMAKEIFPKLAWDDIKNLHVAFVNKAWRALFTSNRVWKSFLQSEWPFVDINNTTEHYQKFKDTWASFHKIACEHPEADVPTAKRVCPCIFPLTIGGPGDHVVYYTGNKGEYVLKSDTCQCHEMIPTKEYLKHFPLVCDSCHRELENSVDICSWKGAPEAKQKWGNAIWIHQELNLAEEIIAAIPIPNSNNLVAITKNNPKKLVLLKITGDEVEQEELVSDCDVDALQISNDGKYIAAYLEHGIRGFVYNLHDNRTTFTFERSAIHLAECKFPVAFFTYENKGYLIAGKDWNRVDLYDPETGESLRERDLTNHHLEYFWCSLHVSPDQKHLCSYGWMWHPVGFIRTFSIDDWMKGNLFAMEHGRDIAESAAWNHPLCWLDNNTVAVWGDSRINWSDHGVPVVKSYSLPPTVPESGDGSITTDTQLNVPLEESPLVFDEYLISLNTKGIELVDVRDGHVLFIRNQRQVEQVLCYNKHSKQVVSIKKNASKVLVLSSIYYYDK
jgi:hypothetical protein